jgi:ubiquinone/menaquinone biosynthesis C-methylase UbiE
MKSLPDPSSVEAWNESMAAKYDVDEFHAHASALVRFVNRRRVAAVLKLLDAGRGDRVLEVGCGTGQVLSLVKCDHRSGVDLSPKLIERARARCGPSVEIQKADAHALPFPDASFDRVYCTEVLEHLLEPAKAVREIARVLVPGGRAVLTIPYERTIDRAKRWLRALGLYALLGSKRASEYEPPQENEWHLHDFDLPMLRAATEGSELVEARVVRVPGWPLPTVHYVVSYSRGDRAP